MLICIDQRNGTGCGAKNPDEAVKCQNCGRSLRFAMQLHNAGTKIGKRYRIIQLLGHGAFGAVYEAEDMQGEWGKVALKETFDPTHIQSFQEEFTTLRNLNHPHLPGYYAAFQAHGVGYLVMELIPGQSLRDVQKKQRGPLAERQVLGYAFQLCDLLDYLHNQQPVLIHRDIKPDNIRLTPDGLLKLVDFGLLKLGEGMTQSMRRGLTRAYAPIEQYPHYPGQTDARTDLYSLGATLYHLLTGKAPIPAPDRLGKSPDPLLPPIQHTPSLTPHVSEAIMGAMVVPQAGRYLNVTQFGQALRGNQVPLPAVQPAPSQREATVRLDGLTSKPSTASQPATSTQPNNQAKYWLPAGIGVAALLCFMLIMAGGTASYYLTAQPTEEMTPPAETEIAQLDDKPTESTPVTTDVPATLPPETPTSLPTETPTEPPTLTPTPENSLPLLHRLGRGSVESLAVSARGDLFAALSTSGIALYDAASYEEVRFIKPDIEDVWQSDLAFSPDGTLIAAGSESGQVGVWQVADGTLLKRWTAYTDTVKGMAFSPDGNILATSSRSWELSDIDLWQMPEGKHLKTLAGHEDGVNSLAFSPDGTLLASGGQDNQLILWQVEAGSIFKELKGHANSVNNVAFSPDGETLASGGYDDAVFLWQVADGTLLDTLGYDSVDALAFSPDGEFLATGDGGSGDICQLSSRVCDPFWRELHDLHITSLVFLDNNRLVVKSNRQNNVTVWQLSEFVDDRVDGEQVSEITQWGYWVDLSPDGKVIATTINNIIQLWSVSDGQLRQSMSIPDGYIGKVKFSPDNQTLVSTVGSDGPAAIYLWQISDGTLLHHWSSNEEAIYKLLFSPNGSILATGDWGDLVELWNIPDGTLLQTFEYDDYVSDIAFLDNETFIIHTSGNENLLHFLDTQSGELLYNSAPFEGSYLTFSPDKTLFATTNIVDQSAVSVSVWNRDGSLRYTIEEGDYDTTFSPDGKILVTTIHWHTNFWQADNGTSLNSITRDIPGGTSEIYSPNGHLLAIDNDNTFYNDDIIHLWNVSNDTFVEAERIRQPGYVTSMLFTSDSTKLIVFSSGTAWIWDVSGLY